ncbi:hypothetical protein B0T16DRAFT_181231 [Cercophora newfieldiana]|uniref:Uncharacterized protein n=1 Tax=Cercophora newfieldiana TaxID=92897 RepID=A0AA40CNG1_9PEZI|nr:hypothetical protein B0T16DRAFT_181231 [Cercophora newfieldiana]
MTQVVCFCIFPGIFFGPIVHSHDAAKAWSAGSTCVRYSHHDAVLNMRIHLFWTQASRLPEDAPHQSYSRRPESTVGGLGTNCAVSIPTLGLAGLLARYGWRMEGPPARFCEWRDCRGPVAPSSLHISTPLDTGRKCRVAARTQKERSKRRFFWTVGPRWPPSLSPRRLGAGSTTAGSGMLRHTTAGRLRGLRWMSGDRQTAGRVLQGRKSLPNTTGW